MAADVTQAVSMIPVQGVTSPPVGGPDVPRQMTLPNSLADQINQSNRTGLGLMQMMMQAPAYQPLSNGQVYSASAYGGVHQGQPNPILQGHEQANRAGSEMQAKQQHQVETMYRMNERRMELAKGVSESLLDSDNPNAVKAGAAGMAAYLKATTGASVQPDWLVKRAELGKGEAEQINALIIAKTPPADIIALHPKLQRMPNYLETQRRLLSDPNTRRIFGYKTNEEYELEGNERRIDLKLRTDKVGAQDRIDQGIGTPVDLRLAGFDTPEKVGAWALEHSLSTGQPVPPMFKPYVDSFQRSLQLKGITNKTALAITMANGDLNKAWAILQQDKKQPRPTKSEFDFALASERRSLLEKQQAGHQLTHQETIRLASIEDYMKRGSGETTTTTERPVALNDNTRAGYQSTVGEIAAGLPRDASPTVTVNGAPVPKTKLIEKRYEQLHPGQRIQVVWNGKEFLVVRVWEESETTRTKGPAGSARRSGPLNPEPADTGDAEE